MLNSVVVLGSTGSIGRATLNLCKRGGIEVEAIVGNSNTALLQKQIDEFKPKFVAVGDKEKAKEINHPKVLVGEEGILELLELSQSELVINSLVGYAGVAPTLKALSLGKRLSLANKESLVVAGAFIDTSNIIPIDSEHFGLKYLLDCSKKPLKRLIITASGGAFRNWEIKKIKRATYQDALKHPNWSMGEKITIDSATMMNKLFELLEAKWLFNTQNVDALIEEKSIIHALVEFMDGSTTAHFAKASMDLPIAYALFDEVKEPILESINLLSLGEIKFKEIDSSRYPIWQIKSDILENPKRGVVLNASNEAVIELFKEGKISFFELSKMILKAYEKFENFEPKRVEDIPKIDKEVREFIKGLK